MRGKGWCEDRQKDHNNAVQTVLVLGYNKHLDKELENYGIYQHKLLKKFFLQEKSIIIC